MKCPSHMSNVHKMHIWQVWHAFKRLFTCAKNNPGLDLCPHQLACFLMKVWSSQVVAWCDHISDKSIDFTMYLISSINRSCTKWYSVMHMNGNIDATWHTHTWFSTSQLINFILQVISNTKTSHACGTFFCLNSMGCHTKSPVAITFYQIVVF